MKPQYNRDRTGWYVRLDDRDAWTGPFEEENGARWHVVEEFGVDPSTGEKLEMKLAVAATKAARPERTEKQRMGDFFFGKGKWGQ